MDFVNLHCHTMYSVLDGGSTPTELLTATKDLGYSALSITDHGTLSGHRDFQRSAAEVGIKPILGQEAYISPTTLDDKTPAKKREQNTSLYNHIILQALNQEGLRNLQKMNEIAWRDGFYYKNRIDKEVLAEHRDGIVVLSGCMGGLISKAIEREDIDEAKLLTAWFKRTFEENFYMELQAHNPPELNHALLELADKYNVKPVVTTDAHFAKEDFREIEEALLILSTGPKMNKQADMQEANKMPLMQRYDYLYPDRPISFAHIDVFIAPIETISAQLATQGIVRPELFENTLEIADKVTEYEYYEKLDLLPRITANPNELLREKALLGLKQKGLDTKPYLDRVEEELNVIVPKDFSSYFLIVADLIQWGREQDISFGAGRGSSAASILAYALGITQVDSLKYNLPFSRFLDPSRDDPPDVDIDVQDDRRDELKAYLADKYQNVASIVTLMRFKDKGVIKDCAKVLGVPYNEANEVMKGMEVSPDSDFFDDFKLLRKDFCKKYPDVMKLATALRGKVKSTGMHPAGVVISKEPLSNHVPIETAKDAKNDTRVPVVAYDLEDVADIGLIKIDLLGLKTLTVVKHCLAMIKKRHNKDIDLASLEFDDPAIYKDLSAGHTKGIFQVEQMAYTNLLIKLQPETFEDLYASNALVRPGAMNTIGQEYIDRRSGKSPVVFDHPIIEKYTGNTFGLVCFQEQLMQLCINLGGMSAGEANKVRKIIGKKRDPEEFEKYKAKFVEGASQHISVKKATKLWSDFVAHSKYSFNAAHSVSYSMLTYYTAWLKHYYPAEYIFAMISKEDKAETVASYLTEAKRLGIDVLVPHVNESEAEMILDAQGRIRLGLASIKFISPASAEKILSKKPFNNYTELQDWINAYKNGLNVRMLNSLNAVGAAELEGNALKGNESDNYYEYLNMPVMIDYELSSSIRRLTRTIDQYDQESCFFMVAMVRSIKRGVGWSRVDFTDITGEAGVFAAGDIDIAPGSTYLVLVSNNRVEKYIDIQACADLPFDVSQPLEDDEAMVVAFTSRKTKANKNMANIVLLDSDGMMSSVVVFSSMFLKAYSRCKPGAVIKPKLSETKDGSILLEDVK